MALFRSTRERRLWLAVAVAVAALLVSLYPLQFALDALRARNLLRLTIGGLFLLCAAAGEMGGALSHELNQPLTAMAAYGSACEQLLERGADDIQFREVIRKMIKEADRAANVVRRLRDFFRTGATHLERIPLNELIEAVSAPFSTKAATAGIDFVVGTVPPAIVNADRLQIEVVLRNLLANALEALAGSDAALRRVTLDASVEEGGRVVIEVADTGPGLPESIAEQIFEPFRSTKSSGLGLGLAISRAIAEAHGGTLTAGTGKGGYFRLVLPLEAPGKWSA